VKSAVDLKQSGGLLFALLGMSLFNVPLPSQLLLLFPSTYEEKEEDNAKPTCQKKKRKIH